MATTITYRGELTVLTCHCGIKFAAPENLWVNATRKGTALYCPLGHAAYWTDTETDKLRKETERLKASIAYRDRQIASREEDVRAEKASHAATKGKLTKTAKKLKSTEVRAANGVCPCCQRSFTDTGLARHIATKHPEFVSA